MLGQDHREPIDQPIEMEQARHDVGGNGYSLQRASQRFDLPAGGTLYELRRSNLSELEASSSLPLAYLWQPESIPLPSRPWCAIEISRGGKPFERDVDLRRALELTLSRCAEQNASVLLVEGCNLHDWIEFGAMVHGLNVVRFRVALIEDSLANWFGRLHISPPNTWAVSPPISESGHSLRVDLPWRDQIAFALADQLRILDLRPDGSLATLVSTRLSNEREDVSRRATTWLRITERSSALIQNELMGAGGIGWYFPASQPTNLAESDPPATINHVSRIMYWQEWIEVQNLGDTDESWPYLVHCTRSAEQPWPDESHVAWQSRIYWSRDETFNSPEISLERIIAAKRLLGTSRTTRGEAPVVCFSARPLMRLLSQRTYRSHLKRWDYEPYGIGIRRSWLEQHGARPVVYGDRKTYLAMSADERPWFQDRGKTYDWTQEQEWRCKDCVDLKGLSREDGFVFVPDVQTAERVARADCEWTIVIVNE